MNDLILVLIAVSLIFVPTGVISFLMPNDEVLLLACLTVNSFMFILGYYLAGFIKRNLNPNNKNKPGSLETKNIEGKFEDEDE